MQVFALKAKEKCLVVYCNFSRVCVSGQIFLFNIYSQSLSQHLNDYSLVQTKSNYICMNDVHNTLHILPISLFIQLSKLNKLLLKRRNIFEI